MRIVMPLLGYESTGVDRYTFIAYPFGIEELKHEDIIETKLFSEQDIWHMELQQWCLIYDGEDLTNYIDHSNLLLMAFRVSSPLLTPFIKFRICKESLDYCRRLCDPIVSKKLGTTPLFWVERKFLKIKIAGSNMQSDRHDIRRLVL